MVEIWADIDSTLAISSIGRVKRKRRKIITQKLSQGEYYLPEAIIDTTACKSVTVNHKDCKVVDLVTRAFFPPLSNTQYIEHIDGDDLNNCVDNLRVVECKSPSETWNFIPGFDDHYMISTIGTVIRVRYCKCHKTYAPQIMKTKLDADGYVRVSLTSYDSGHAQSREWGVHQLVARAFISNPDTKPTVNHKDGNKLNNSVDNLEWATWSENNLHAIRTGLREGKMVAARKASKAKISKPVRCVQLNQVFESCSEAERQLGLGSTTVYCSMIRNRPTKYGYTFEYV